MQRLETNPGREIEDVLRVSYERLHENDQMLFLHIAVFFNYKDCDLVEAMLVDDGNLDVKNWLKVLVNKSLIEINPSGEIVMHKLLQQVGRQAISRQEPWKRQIIINAHDICDLLEYDKGTRVVSGISFDISNIDEVFISKKAFKRMPNLRFLKIYKSRDNGDYRMHIPEEMEFPRRLRLLDWKAYPSKSFPPKFNPEYLVELSMQGSQLEKLWEGIQPLKNLKYMDLSASKNLKEVPDLSNATNLERLDLSYCESLVEIPSSFSHLHKLHILSMLNCINLQVIPAHMNLASLEFAFMGGSTRLRNIPLLSTNITRLHITVEDVPPSIRLCSRLELVGLFDSGKLKGLTHLPMSVTHLYIHRSDIERIPDCIKALHNLLSLDLYDCKRLSSLPEFPGSLISLDAENCESLETMFSPLSTPNAEINFTNCFKLGQQARRGIIRRSFFYSKTIIPGREVPAEFDNRARGSSLTIVLDGNRSYRGFVFCVLFFPNQPIPEKRYSPRNQPIRELGSSVLSYWWRRIIAQDDGYPVEGFVTLGRVNECQTEHLSIFHYRFEELYRPKVSREMMFEFSCSSIPRNLEIIECGAKILTQEESIEWSSGSGSDQASEDDIEFEPSEVAFEDNTENGDPTNIDGQKQKDCWSWLFLCFGLEEDDRKKAEAD